MAEQHDIAITEADGPNPPDLLKYIVEQVEKLVPGASNSAGLFVRGKGETEIAKAAEIRARVITAIGQLEHERQRLVHERDVAIRAAENEHARDQMAHEEKMFELKTQRLKAVVQALEQLAALGIDVTLEVKRLSAALD